VLFSLRPESENRRSAIAVFIEILSFFARIRRRKVAREIGVSHEGFKNAADARGDTSSSATPDLM